MVFDPSFHLRNDLETVTLALYPELVRIKDLLKSQGAIGALMSGSGPSIFGLYPEAEVLRRARAELEREEELRVFSVDLLTGPASLVRSSETAAGREGNAR